jgi:hypothetical protein
MSQTYHSLSHSQLHNNGVLKTAQWVARLAGDMPPGPQAWLAALDLAAQACVENKLRTSLHVLPRLRARRE